MKNTRKGLGKGMGTGYKNLAPMDSHIHSLSAKGVKSISLKRAVYGKPKVPLSDREYSTMNTSMPVGTIKEWKTFLKDSGVKKVKLIDPIEGDSEVELKAKKRKIYPISDKNAFTLKLENMGYDVIDVMEFMDEHWQNQASDKKNLELFKEFVAEDYDDVFPSPTKDLKLNAKSNHKQIFLVKDKDGEIKDQYMTEKQLKEYWYDLKESNEMKNLNPKDTDVIIQLMDTNFNIDVTSLNAKGKKLQDKSEAVIDWKALWSGKIPSNFTKRDLEAQQRKKKWQETTKREKKLGLYNVLGAGAGFVVGTLTGGLGGMLIGVPIGTYTGFALGELTLGKEKGRKPKYTKSKSKFWQDFWIQREEELEFRYQKRKEVAKAKREAMKNAKKR